MKHRWHKPARITALVFAAAASLATSLPPERPLWTYSETSEPHPFSLEAAAPTARFNVTVSTSEAMTEASDGRVILLARLSGENEKVSVLVMVTGSNGSHAAAALELEPNQAAHPELEAQWLDSCDETGCTGNVLLSFALEEGQTVSGSFEDITAIVDGPLTDGEENPPPPDSDVSIQIEPQ